MILNRDRFGGGSLIKRYDHLISISEAIIPWRTFTNVNQGGDNMNTRLQFNVSESMNDELAELMGKYSMKSKTELFNNSVTILNWASKQLEQGRIVGSIDPQTDSYRELSMPIFENVPLIDDNNDNRTGTK